MQLAREGRRVQPHVLEAHHLGAEADGYMVYGVCWYRVRRMLVWCTAGRLAGRRGAGAHQKRGSLGKKGRRFAAAVREMWIMGVFGVGQAVVNAMAALEGGRCVRNGGMVVIISRGAQSQ